MDLDHDQYRMSCQLTALRHLVEVPVSCLALGSLGFVLFGWLFSVALRGGIWVVLVFVTLYFLLAIRMVTYLAVLVGAKHVFLLHSGIKVVDWFREEYIPFNEIEDVRGCLDTHSSSIQFRRETRFGKQIMFLWPWFSNSHPDGPTAVRELRKRVNAARHG
jgi:hypothetical protein